MKQEALIAWTSLYIAVGIMALLCAVLAVAVTADDWRTKRWRPALESGLDKTLLLLFMVDSALNIVFWGFVSLLFLWGWLPGVGAAEPGSEAYQLCVQDPDCNPADAVNGTSDDFHFLEVLGACGLTALLTVRLPPLPSTCLCGPRCPRSLVQSCRSQCAALSVCGVVELGRSAAACRATGCTGSRSSPAICPRSIPS